jgi:glycosyltransferase involved in cell wall biosynthesis
MIVLEQTASETDAAMPDAADTAPPAVCLSVVIPCYNERDTIVEVLSRVRAVPIEKEIIIVDDGSTDGTRDVLNAMEPAADLRIVFQDRNRGKGAALRAGFLLAKGDIVIVQDADLEYDPAEFPRLVQPILDGHADVVYGSRFLRPETRRVLSFWHSLGNRVVTTLSNFFTDLHLTDMETCYKVFRRQIIQELTPRLKQNRFGIEPEITAKLARAGHRIYEVAIGYNARSYKQGKKIGWRDGLNALWCILRYWRCD